MSNLSITDETSENASDGSATANPTGGTMPYGYAWSTGENTSSIENLPPGEYMLTITDSNGCELIESIIIASSDCPPQIIDLVVTNTSCNNLCDGALEFIGYEDASVEITDILWSTGDNGMVISNLCAGEYGLTVTDINNCITMDTYIIEEPDALFLEIVDVQDITESSLGSIVINTFTSFVANWTGPNEYSSSAFNIINLEIGCYTLNLSDPITNCTIDTTICIDDLTSINDVHEAFTNVLVYPNPSSGKIFVDFEDSYMDEATIQVIGFEGKMYDEFVKPKIESTLMLDLEFLNSGVYLLKINGLENSNVYYKRFIILDQ